MYPFPICTSHSSPLSFNSWLCTCCRSWNRRTSSKQPRRVATGASWQRTTCCGGRNVEKKVSLDGRHASAASPDAVRACIRFWNWSKLKPEPASLVSSQSALIGIDEPLPLKKRKIVKPGFTHSPWKSAYIRQHRIDTNWRRGDLKSPKVALPSDGIPHRLAELPPLMINSFESQESQLNKDAARRVDVMSGSSSCSTVKDNRGGDQDDVNHQAKGSICFLPAQMFPHKASSAC